MSTGISEFAEVLKYTETTWHWFSLVFSLLV